MKNILTITAIILLTPAIIYAAVITYPNRGGTGTSVIPAKGEILVGQGNGTYAPQATSTLGIGGSGTVTSVAQAVPTGFTVSGSPITTSGTLTIAFDTGYSLPTTASQTNWNTAYGWGDHSVVGYLTTVDISANTNLAVTSPITLTGDTVGIDQSLLSITESQISDLSHYSTFNSDFDTRLSATTSLPNITTLANLLITESQISDLVHTTDTNANTICTGTGNYLDGEGNCDALDPAGTDNSTNVTLSGTYNYLTLTGQDIALGQIDLTTDVTGLLPIANGGTGASSLANLITLATDTVGNFVATITGTAEEITVSGSGTENAGVTLSLPAIINLGAKTSLEIPNGTNPSVTLAGQIAEDTTDNQLILGASAKVIRTQTELYNFSLASTSNEYKTSLAELPLKPDGFTISGVMCYVVGATSVDIYLTDGTNNTNTITCSTTRPTSPTAISTNGVFTAGEQIDLVLGTKTGSPDKLVVTVIGTWTRE